MTAGSQGLRRPEHLSPVMVTHSKQILARKSGTLERMYLDTMIWLTNRYHSESMESITDFETKSIYELNMSNKFLKQPTTSLLHLQEDDPQQDELKHQKHQRAFGKSEDFEGKQKLLQDFCNS